MAFPRGFCNHVTLGASRAVMFENRFSACREAPLAKKFTDPYASFRSRVVTEEGGRSRRDCTTSSIPKYGVWCGAIGWRNRSCSRLAG
jgi:hypothetical protein